MRDLDRVRVIFLNISHHNGDGNPRLGRFAGYEAGPDVGEIKPVRLGQDRAVRQVTMHSTYVLKGLQFWHLCIHKLRAVAG